MGKFMAMQKIQLGDLLVEHKKITKQELDYILELQKKLNYTKKMGELLIKEGLITESEMVELIASQLKISITSFDEESELDLKLINKIPLKIIEKYGALPIKETQKDVIVAFIDPMDVEARTNFQRYFKKPIRSTISLSNDIKKRIAQLQNREKVHTLIEQIKNDLKGKDNYEDNSESSTLKLIKYIITLSIQKRASDIHIETEEDTTQVRSRIDGSLQNLLIIEKEIFDAIAARIKLLAKLNISEKRKPQDGRFSMELDGHSFDFRVSTLPIATGESIVIRILDKRNVMKKLEDIGIGAKNLGKYSKALKSPNGIVLVTGPTGSGKSTTLYASLNKIKNIEEKIITVEDPVEYQMKLIQQVQVDENLGLTFSTALRSILRQDPDVIMIGEIRDTETLEIAIKAALTGHLVISTLHTNNAVSAISRLIDMGADPFLVGAALVAVEAQRLVKRICPHCKAKDRPNTALLEPIKHIIPPTATFYKGIGCEKCNMTGYKGRMLITEVFSIDEESSSAIAQNVPLLELENIAKKKGYEPMFMDGLIKALKGETSLEEIYRVSKVDV